MMLYCTKCEKMNCLIGELVCRECAKEEIKCAYCGKTNLVADSKKATIWINHGRREMWFCNNTCASYYQMGAEG